MAENSTTDAWPREYLRMIRNERTAAEIEADLIPSEEFYQEICRVCPEEYCGHTGRERFEFEFRHMAAINLLWEAEDYLCPSRAQALANAAESLDLEALPEDFFRRVVIVQREIAKLGRKRRRTLDRDAAILDQWSILRGTHFRGHPINRRGENMSYTAAISLLAEGHVRQGGGESGVTN